MEGRPLDDVPQTAYLTREVSSVEGDITLYSHEECLKDKKKEAANFRHIEEESNKYAAARILQKVGKSRKKATSMPPRASCKR